MRLVIVESPTKAKTISRFLGPKYKVFSSYGHIRDLPKNELGVDAKKDFEPKYIIIPKAKKTIQFLKKEFEKTDSVIIATDQDREGEAIAWHLVQALGLGKFQVPNHKSQINSKSQIPNSKLYQRIVFHEITKTAIENALKNPGRIDENLVNAQQARRILDRLVGYKLSPFLWKKVARGLSAGRVQSVAVRLVAEREKEIKAFASQEYWTIAALLKKLAETRPLSALQGSGLCELQAILIKKDDKAIPKLGIKTKKQADEIIKGLKDAEYKVINVEKKETRRNPLPPFTTSSLQQEAWRRYRFPAKFTMRLAQRLYETGLITYHRTDSLNLSDLSLFTAKKFILKNYSKNHWAGFLKKYKAKGKTQEAHEAIRPTFANKTPESLKTKLDKSQFKLYDLIWRRFIACQMAQAIFDSTIVEIEAGNPKSQIPNSKQIRNPKSEIRNKYTFRTSGQILKFDGFLRVYPIKYKEAELPKLKKQEILDLIKLIPSQHFTQPPPRYTEATLIKALEENGIGRPSTYAPIISTIQQRNYIQKDEQKRFEPTEIGSVVNNILVNHFPKIVDISFTAKMEDNLDKIAKGQRKWVKVLKDFYDPFEKNLKQKDKELSKKDIAQEKTKKKCPECQANLVIRLGRFGRFYACSGFPKCKYTEPLEKNTLGIKCPKCKIGEIVQKRTKKGKIFYACNQWPKCDFALWDKPTGEKCPECGSLLVQKGKKIACSNKKCDYNELS